MANNKHSKFKNTGILFELLTRQITSDILTGKESKAIKIIEEFFKTDSALKEELYLYHTLLRTRYTNNQTKANHLIDAVLESRKKINQTELRKQKYNLVKKIRDNYNIDNFVKAKIDNYKELASIYKLFESSIGNVLPTEVVTSRYTLIENIISQKLDNKSIIKSDDAIKQYETLDESTRLLSYKYLLEGFNSKYKILNNKQKALLREYVNSVSDHSILREYINKEIIYIKKQIAEISKTITDKITRIKLKEIVNQLKVIKESKGNIKDSHVTALMKFYELIDELKK